MCQHFPSAFIYIKSFALSQIMEIFSDHKMIHAPFGPALEPLKGLGEMYNTMTLNWRQPEWKLAFPLFSSWVSSRVSSCCLLPPTPSTSPMPSIFCSDTWAFLLLSGRDRQQWLLEWVSHGRSGETGECDPLCDIWPLSSPSWFQRIKRQFPPRPPSSLNIKYH